MTKKNATFIPLFEAKAEMDYNKCVNLYKYYSFGLLVKSKPKRKERNREKLAFLWI